MLCDVTPIWRHIAQDLHAGIRDGHYPAGGRLPSIPELSRQYGAEDKPTSRVHVQAAMAWLVTAGLAEARTGSGHWVINVETWEERAKSCEARERGE
jgi:DNA-binding GntR family transcriptional regulator